MNKKLRKSLIQALGENEYYSRMQKQCTEIITNVKILHRDDSIYISSVKKEYAIFDLIQKLSCEEINILLALRELKPTSHSIILRKLISICKRKEALKQELDNFN